MKKFFAFLLTATMLVTMFVVVPSAATTDIVITGVDVPVEENGAVVCTSLESFSNCNPSWSNCLQITPDGDGYKVINQSVCPAEKVTGDVTPDALIEASRFTDAEDDLYLILHGTDANYSVGYNQTVEIDNVAIGGTLSFSGTKKDVPHQDAEKLRISNNVAYKKSYTTSEVYRMGGADVEWGYDPNVAPTYPDDGGELTDRYVPTNTLYNNSDLVGLHDGTPDAAELGYAWVNVDLGEEYNVNEVRCYMPPNAEGGIGPSYVTFVGYKADGTEVEIGYVDKADVVEETNYVYAAVKCDVTVQKVEARLTRGGWTMVSEIVVIAADESSDPSQDESSEPEVIEPEEPTTDIDALLGEANADAKFDAVVTIDPSNYVAGEKITVNVSIENITAANGLDTVELVLNYDQTKLELAETLNGSAISVFNGFAEWEDLTIVNEDGTIALSAGTAGGDTGTQFTFAKNDGEVSFSIEFNVKADATGDIAAWIAHADVFGYYTDGGEDYVGNGSGMAITAATSVTEDQPTGDQPKPGDATSMIFFAVIALVAIAGSAVVIKTRK